MRYISKKIIRYAILDALDRVLRGKEAKALSKNTKMIIYDAAEKISENAQHDFINNVENIPDASSERKSQRRRPNR